MGALVQIHVVKVDGIVGDILTILGSQVQQRLLQEHRAANPVLGRGEGMHPGDDACHFLVVVHVLHELGDALSRGHNPLADHLEGQLAAGVQLVHDIFRIPGHTLQRLLTIEELAASHKPKFIIRDFKHLQRLLYYCI